MLATGGARTCVGCGSGSIERRKTSPFSVCTLFLKLLTRPEAGPVAHRRIMGSTQTKRMKDVAHFVTEVVKTGLYTQDAKP